MIVTSKMSMPILFYLFILLIFYLPCFICFSYLSMHIWILCAPHLVSLVLVIGHNNKGLVVCLFFGCLL